MYGSRAHCERGEFGQGPDSSVSGVPVVNCPDVDHLEEEVQVNVQVEEEEDRINTRRVKERTTAQRG